MSVNTVPTPLCILAGKESFTLSKNGHESHHTEDGFFQDARHQRQSVVFGVTFSQYEQTLTISSDRH